ncbi:hypothetical protein MB46_06280 [Arthrobacter alpinus]|uniref:hypothetical protein n=1 Tax=Arthrobacter alpinus TaxID=656366 RepID=UPI0005CB1DA1|nr:hypothetical protein [Arthrobacter alpinus]ALV45167.1 hypothetical protein MB46_06280 [Arthrobacter alpinus]
MDHVVVEIRRAVDAAGESHRENPRAYRRSRHKIVAQSFEDLAVLEKIAYHIRDLTEVLAATIWDGPLELRLGTELRQPLSLCLDATAGVLRAWEEGTAIPTSLDRAGDTLKAFNSAVSHGRESEAGAFTAGAAIGLDLQRILAALQHGLCSSDESTPGS